MHIKLNKKAEIGMNISKRNSLRPSLSSGNREESKERPDDVVVVKLMPLPLSSLHLFLVFPVVNIVTPEGKYNHTRPSWWGCFCHCRHWSWFPLLHFPPSASTSTTHNSTHSNHHAYIFRFINCILLKYFQVRIKYIKFWDIREHYWQSFSVSFELSVQ